MGIIGNSNKYTGVRKLSSSTGKFDRLKWKRIEFFGIILHGKQEPRVEVVITWDNGN